MYIGDGDFVIDHLKTSIEQHSRQASKQQQQKSGPH